MHVLPLSLTRAAAAPRGRPRGFRGARSWRWAALLLTAAVPVSSPQPPSAGPTVPPSHFPTAPSQSPATSPPSATPTKGPTSPSVSPTASPTASPARYAVVTLSTCLDTIILFPETGTTGNVYISVQGEAEIRLDDPSRIDWQSGDTWNYPFSYPGQVPITTMRLRVQSGWNDGWQLCGLGLAISGMSWIWTGALWFDDDPGHMWWHDFHWELPTLSPTISASPTLAPTMNQSVSPSTPPSAGPTAPPSAGPTAPPSAGPTAPPTLQPTALPTVRPAGPSAAPTSQPSRSPSLPPTAQPTTNPSMSPTLPPVPPGTPSESPAVPPTTSPSAPPTAHPTLPPSSPPAAQPSANPSRAPAERPSVSPTLPPIPPGTPSESPAVPPTTSPSALPTAYPTLPPSSPPAGQPSASPGAAPTRRPSTPPTLPPVTHASSAPTKRPTAPPSPPPALLTPAPEAPSGSPAPPTGPPARPSSAPTLPPFARPTAAPFPPAAPTPRPASRAAPTAPPVVAPTGPPSGAPHPAPSAQPSAAPSLSPGPPLTLGPLSAPTTAPAKAPTAAPRTPALLSLAPTRGPQGPAPAAAAPSAAPVAPQPPPELSVTPTYTQFPTLTQVVDSTDALHAVSRGVVNTATAVAGVAALMSMSASAASQGPKMARFFDYSTCPPDDHGDLGWMANPTGAGKRSRGGAATYDDPAVKQAERRAAMLANLGIVAGFAAFNALIGVAIMGGKRACGDHCSLRSAMGTARFPSFTMFPVLFMLQNVVEPALNLIYYDPRWGDKALALVVSTAVLAGMSYFVWRVTHPSFFQAAYEPDPGKAKAKDITVFLWGDHMWKSSAKDDTFERRFALVFKDFKGKYRRFLLCDIAVVAVISALSAFIAQNAFHCTVQIVLATLTELLYLALVFKYRPFIAELDHWYTVLLTACQVVAISLALVAMHDRHQGLLTASAGLLLLSTTAMIVKGLFDLYTFVRDRWLECRAEAVAEAARAARAKELGVDQALGHGSAEMAQNGGAGRDGESLCDSALLICSQLDVALGDAADSLSSGSDVDRGGLRRYGTNPSVMGLLSPGSSMRRSITRRTEATDADLLSPRLRLGGAPSPRQRRKRGATGQRPGAPKMRARNKTMAGSPTSDPSRADDSSPSMTKVTSLALLRKSTLSSQPSMSATPSGVLITTPPCVAQYLSPTGRGRARRAARDSVVCQQPDTTSAALALPEELRDCALHRVNTAVPAASADSLSPASRNRARRACTTSTQQQQGAEGDPLAQSAAPPSDSPIAAGRARVRRVARSAKHHS
eukprot:TRINITY_DN5908_c0_g1_i12.p1 TRINITY_DN5908_c0_g1~~TRINITY_DN5908_c0_g1_i12.p1  ORF type:complete len:1320 (+),score=225.96 TRINITY_DN5908_c0_g1_i12:89-3961(+)